MKTFNRFYILSLWLALFTGILISCKPPQKNSIQSNIVPVAEFKGQQVTGVTVSKTGRVFANFPRWRPTVEYSVVEVGSDGSSKPFPNIGWNRWKPGNPVSDSAFVAVQSVVANAGKLYVLDTRNPLWKGVVDAPRIFVFNLENHALEDVLVLSKNSFKPGSYVNDLRIDEAHQAIYMTDSNEPGLIVYNWAKRQSRRVLENHYSTSAEADHLTIDGRKWNNAVHSDGIALNLQNNRLYYHALTGYTLYSASTALLREGAPEEIEKDIVKEAETPATDGMVFDPSGNLYMADLGHVGIVYLSPKGKINTLCKGKNVGWADTFSIYDGYLYYTNSRIHEVKGDVSDMVFTIYKVRLAKDEV